MEDRSDKNEDRNKKKQVNWKKVKLEVEIKYLLSSDGEEEKCEEERKKQQENQQGVGEEDEVDKKYRRASERFENIMEEDRKRQERVKSNRMEEAKKMADEMFEAAIKM